MTDNTLRTVAGSDGVAIAAEISGAGGPLLLVHGTSADRTRWAPLLPYLTDRYTCYALDRRGRGDSGDGEGGGSYALEMEFGDLAAVADSVAHRHGQPVDVFAHSYGALCTFEAALRTDAVGRLALYEPPIPTGVAITEPDALEALRAAAAAGDRDAILETFARRVVRYPLAEYEMLRALPAWQQRRAAAHTIPRELAALDNGYRFDAATVAKLDRPVLLLLGSDSPDFLQRATQRLHDTLPRSTLEVMDGQQHNAIDAAPEDVAARVRAFLTV